MNKKVSKDVTSTPVADKDNLQPSELVPGKGINDINLNSLFSDSDPEDDDVAINLDKGKRKRQKMNKKVSKDVSSTPVATNMEFPSDEETGTHNYFKKMSKVEVNHFNINHSFHLWLYLFKDKIFRLLVIFLLG